MSLTIYNEKIECMNTKIEKLLEEKQKLVYNKSSLIIQLNDIKAEFKLHFKNCYEDLEHLLSIISASNNSKISSEYENINDDDSELSPAASQPILLWPNGLKEWVHDNQIKHETFTLNGVLPITFNIPVKVIKAITECIAIGVSGSEVNTKSRYLGLPEISPDSWVTSGNGVISEKGTFNHSGLKWNEGDIINIIGNHGKISYQVKVQLYYLHSKLLRNIKLLYLYQIHKYYD